MVADLYLGWAYYFEAVGNFAKADEIYKMGLGARAQPIETLKHAQTQLHIMAAEGVRCRDDEEYNSKLLAHMGERRFALTSLHGRTKKKLVGSLRTDQAVKSRTPGLVLQENVKPTSNIGHVDVFTADQVAEDGGAASTSASSIKSVVDSALKAQENMREPGPWSQCAQKGGKKGSLFSKKEIEKTPGFEICTDNSEGEISTDEPKGIQLPPGFVRQNEPQDEVNYPLTLVEETKAVPAYIKKFVYPPGQNKAFSLEEIRGYRYWRNRMVKSENIRIFKEMESFMEGINVPENFSKKNAPQSSLEPEYYPFEGNSNLQAMCRVLSVNGCHKSYEELLKEKYLAAKRQREESKSKQKTTIFVDGDSVMMDIEDMEVEQDNPQRRSSSPNGESPFGFNETCSTQIFNLFIKPQSISTPNRNKGGGSKDKPSIPRSSLSLYKYNQQGMMNPGEAILESSMEGEKLSLPPPPAPKPIPHASTSAQQNTSPEIVHYNGKQLSVIMETTESSASSGGCQTTTDATTIGKSCDTRFGVSTIHTTMDPGVLSLTAKPRKSILKRADTSIMESPVVEAPKATEQPFSVFVDEPEVIEKTKVENKFPQNENASFAKPSMPPPSASNIPVYRDSMDFFGAPAPVPKSASDFAMPMPPKAKTFMPLYNDSMEQFMEKAKTVPRIPIVQMDEEEEPKGLFAAGDSINYKMTEREAFEEKSKAAVADFSIFHDSMMGCPKEKSMRNPGVSGGAIPKEKSLLGLSSKENNPVKSFSPNVSLSPLKSFMQQQSSHRQAHNDTNDSGEFFDSPQKKFGGGGRSKDAIYGTSTESTMPTIAAIDPMLLENSMTFPSMKEITSSTMMLHGKTHNNQSMLKDRSMMGKSQHFQQSTRPGMPHDLMEESMTFNTLLKREGGNKSVKVAGGEGVGGFHPNLSILSLHKELMDDEGDGMGGAASAMAPAPKPAGLGMMDDSMTFNTLMRKEAKGITSIAGGVENMHLAKPEPTSTMLSFPKPKLLDDSLTFNSLMKKEGKRVEEDTDLLFVRPPNPDQSAFPMELPSSTAHGFSIFTSKKAFVPEDHTMRMEKSISPIPSIRHDEVHDLMDEEEEDQPAQDDIYKWENTLRELPETEEPNLKEWYNENLEAPANHSVRVKKQEEESGERPRKIGDQDYVDPFDPDLINNFLAQVDFVNYVHKLNECDMRETIPPLRQGGVLEICDQVFNVRKLIGKGAFGQIYSAKNTEGRLVALKQSRPCNLWEYYICMEVKFRLKEFNEELVSGLSVQYRVNVTYSLFLILPVASPDRH